MKTMTAENIYEHDMAAIAHTMAAKAFSGMFIALYGELGAGKTAFVRAFAGALGIGDITSPTFTIVCEHESDTGIPLLHFDAYRLENEDELYAIGFDDYMQKNGIMLMEWADRVPEALPNNRLDIFIEGSGFEARRIKISAFGRYYEQLLEAM